MGEISRRQFLKSASALTAIGTLAALTPRFVSGYQTPQESQKMKVMDLDGFLDNHHLQEPYIDDFLRLTLAGALLNSAQAVYLKPEENEVQQSILIDGVEYDHVNPPIPGFRIYNELKRRAQNPEESRFIARYERKDHLVEMLIRADDDKREMLELKIAA